MNPPYLLGIILALCLSVCSCKQKLEAGNRTTGGRSGFELGQVWTFHEPSNQLFGATLTIMQIDADFKYGHIINVLVAPVTPDPKLALYNMAGTTNIFLAFSEDALNRSVITLVKTNATVPTDIWNQFVEAYQVEQLSIKDAIADKCFTNTVSGVLEKRLRQH